MAHSAKRPCGFGTTDYRLLTFDPDPGIDDRESVVHCPQSVVSLRFSLSPQNSLLSTESAVRLAPWNILSTEALSFHSRHYSTGRTPWNTHSAEVQLFVHSTIPQGESSFPRFLNPKFNRRFQILLPRTAFIHGESLHLEHQGLDGDGHGS